MDQDRVVSQLRELFPDARIVDRRTAPSHGYRAMHVVVMIEERPVEIQVRTALQQRWAELSEKWSDVDPDIKYGGGDREMRAILLLWSDIIHNEDLLDEMVRRLGVRVTELAEGSAPDESQSEAQDIRLFLDKVLPTLQDLRAAFDGTIQALERRTS